MKKLLLSLSCITIFAGATTSLISCGKKQQNPNIEKPKPKPEPPTKVKINLDEIIKNKDLGTILHKTESEILKAIKDKNKDLIEKEIDINSICDNYAIIEAKKNSDIYYGSVKVNFSLEIRLEKLTTENKFISNLNNNYLNGERPEVTIKRMLIFFVCANWPISSLDNFNQINEIANKLTIEDYNESYKEAFFEVTIKPNEKGIKEYSGFVKVTFYNFSVVDNHNEEYNKSNLAYIYNLLKAIRIGKPNDLKEETILSMISKVETHDRSICKGKPIDISKINIKLAKNKLSVIVEPKKDIYNQIYNGIVRLWFANGNWNIPKI